MFNSYVSIFKKILEHKGFTVVGGYNNHNGKATTCAFGSLLVTLHQRTEEENNRLVVVILDRATTINSKLELIKALNCIQYN